MSKFDLAPSTILEGRDMTSLVQTAQNLARELGKFIYVEHQDSEKYVDEVRKIYEYTRGVQSQPFTIIINADSLFGSIQAQNAFLKIFEEPGENIFLILLTTNAQKLLPTIRSRAACQNLGGEVKSNIDAAQTWFNGTIFDRLTIVAKIKTRADAINYVQNLAQTLPKLARKNPNLVKTAPALAETLDNLVQNGNVKAQLMNLALQMYSVK
jgi:DNA polymerase III delta prime subunit